MNKFLKSISVLLFVLTTTITVSFAQKKYFSGIYTIGGSNANYSTIQRAVSDLINSNSEVIGRVTFNIRPGTYNENIVLKPFNGASAKNYVVFKSETGKASDVIIQDDGDNTLYNNQVIRFEGCNFYTLSDLTIINTRDIVASNNYSSVIHLTYNRDNRKPSESNTITRCILKVDEDFTVFNGNTIAIVASDINNTSVPENCANYNNITNNQIYGGSFGIRMLGKSSALPARGNKISGNKFFNCYSGIDIDYSNIPLISGNEINCRTNPNESQFGIRVKNAAGNFSWHSNIVRNFGTFGMFFYNVNAGAAAYIYNNMIVADNTTPATISKKDYSRGVHVEFSRNMQFYNNTIHYTASFNANNAAFVIENSQALPALKISLKNNIFYSTGGAATVIIRSAASLDTCNYNNYYLGFGSTLAIVGGTNRTNLTQLKLGTGRDGQSLSLNPQFSSTSTLRLENENLIGTAYVLPFIQFDFENHPRDPEMPDFGADEVIRSNTDLQTFGLQKNFVPKEGLNTLPVVIKNDGLLSLNGNIINISYKINNGAYTAPESFPLTQLSKSYTKQVFNLAAKWNIPLPGQYTLTIRVSPPVPNDTWQKNDSVVLQICVGLNGAYTIGNPAGGNKNYPTFAAAIAAFDCGIGGPTVFNVYPGTYAPFSIPIVKGATPTNTLTFRSVTGNAADVIIQNTITAQNALNHYTVQFDGADYVILKNLTIQNTASTTQFASGVHITNNSDNVTVDSCIITVPISNGITEKKFPIVLSDKSKIDSGAYTQGVYIKNSTLRNGVASVQIYGRNTSNRGYNINILNNSLDSAFHYGIRTEYINVANVSGNKINMRSASSSTSEGISIFSSKANTIINANKVIRAGYRGLNLTSVEGITDVVISNNMIGGGFKSILNGAGVYLNEVNKVSLYNNSVLYNASSTENPNNSAAFFLAAGSNVSLYNNIFSCSGNGYAFYVTSQNSLRASDYNCYYTDDNTTAGLYAYWGSDRTNMTQLKNAMSGFEVNSIETNPLFLSTIDLHTTNPLLETKGKYFDFIPFDFDNEPRNPIQTDIGADEFILNAKDLALIEIQPLVFSTTPNQINVKLMNLGSTSLNGNTVKLQYSTDGVNWTPAAGESISIGSNANNTLATPYSNFVYTFNSVFNASANNAYQFRVRIMPSDRIVGDPVFSNDSIKNLICTGLNAGTYTIGGASPTFNTINDAVNAIACGITGPVTFNIRPGTYSERFTINNPKNTSETNKIIFRSEDGNVNSVIISSNGVSGATTRNIVRLNRSKFIVFDNLTFKNSSNSIAGSAGIQLTSQASDITIKNCVIMMDTNSNTPNIFGIVSSDSSSLSVAGKSASNVKIINNKIYGGNAGIILNGFSQYARESGIIIDSNYIYKAASFGIFTLNNDVNSIHANKIIMRAGVNNSTGLSMIVNRADTRITNNLILNSATQAVNFDDLVGINGVLFANNMLGGKFRAGSNGSGINMVKVNTFKMYYNSILYNGTSVFGSALKMDAETKAVRLLNNSLYNSGIGYCITSGASTNLDTSDNNNLFTKGTFFARVGSTDYMNFEEYRENTLTDEKSVNVDPDYFTDSNLHMTNQFLEGGAFVVTEINTDFDGEPRHVEFPDIGADEFLIRGDVKVTSIDNPLPSPEVYPDSIPVIITVENPGLSKISGLNVKYYIDNVEMANEVIPVEEPYKPLLPSDVLTYQFSKYIVPPATGTYKLRVEAYLPDDIDLTNNAEEVDFFSSISSIIDGSITNIVSPAASKIDKPTEVIVMIKNAGTVTIKDFDVNYYISGGTPQEAIVSTEPFLDSILPLQSAAFKFSSKIDCHPTNVRTLIVYISNLADDINGLNDRDDKILINYAGCGQVGIDQVAENIFMNAPWPNPSNDAFNFELNLLKNGNLNIELIDVLGKTIKSINIEDAQQGIQQIALDVKDVTPGIYYTRVSFDNEVLTNKVLVSE